MRTDNRTLWIAVAELVVLALLTMLTHWRWGNIAYWIAFFLVVPAIVVAIWFRDYFQACLALIAVVLLIQAICVTVAFRNRLREQADTVASMRRIASRTPLAIADGDEAARTTICISALGPCACG